MLDVIVAVVVSLTVFLLSFCLIKVRNSSSEGSDSVSPSQDDVRAVGSDSEERKVISSVLSLLLPSILSPSGETSVEAFSLTLPSF